MLPTKWHLDPSSHLATTDMGRKLGIPPPFGGGGAGFPSNTMSLGLRPMSLPSGILIHPAIWPQQIWAENWELCTFVEGKLGPHSTMWPGPRPTSTPSGILIHPTVWPQLTRRISSACVKADAGCIWSSADITWKTVISPASTFSLNTAAQNRNQLHV